MSKKAARRTSLEINWFLVQIWNVDLRIRKKTFFAPRSFQLKQNSCYDPHIFHIQKSPVRIAIPQLINSPYHTSPSDSKVASTIAELNNGPYHLLVLYDLSKMVRVIDFLPTLIERFIIRIRTCQNEWSMQTI